MSPSDAAKDLAPRLTIVSGHLVEEVDACTCGSGSASPHEQYCGIEMIMSMEDLAEIVLRGIEQMKYPLRVISSKLDEGQIVVTAEVPDHLADRIRAGSLQGLSVAAEPAELCLERSQPVPPVRRSVAVTQVLGDVAPGASVVGYSARDDKS